MKRAFANGQFLQPIEFRLGDREPAIEREGRVGREFRVEQAALGRDLVPLLAGNLELPPGGLQPRRCGSVE